MSKESSNLAFAPKLNKEFLRENKFLIAGVILGLFFLIAGLIQLISQGNQGTQIEIVPTESEVEVSTQQIVVDVAGAVKKPGVYSLKPGARVARAIEAAGNFSPKADLAWVAKNLNLAAKLSDGGKIYIPTKNEAGQVSTLAPQVITTSDKININTASQSQLESLPAVGPVTAAKIIAARPYNSIDELLTKKVIGRSTFEKIKDLVSIF